MVANELRGVAVLRCVGADGQTQIIADSSAVRLAEKEAGGRGFGVFCSCAIWGSILARAQAPQAEPGGQRRVRMGTAGVES